LSSIDPINGGIDDAEYGRSKHYPKNETCKVKNQYFPALWHLKFLKITGPENSELS
jgi:hypothetical protein